MQTGMANDGRYKACRVHAFGDERMVVVSDEHTGFTCGRNSVNVLEARIVCCDHVTTSLL